MVKVPRCPVRRGTLAHGACGDTCVGKDEHGGGSRAELVPLLRQLEGLRGNVPIVVVGGSDDDHETSLEQMRATPGLEVLW